MDSKYNIKLEQYKAIKDLEKLIGKSIPFKNYKNLYTFGVYIENDDVIGLGLKSQLLNKLPDSIGNLTSLQILDVSFNRLKALPESIGNLNHLKELRLQRNLLTTLPDTIGNLKTLRSLDVSFNKLVILPDSIGNLSSLKKCDLRKNALEVLPKSFKNLNSLQVVNFRLNPLAPKERTLFFIKRIYVPAYAILILIILPLIGLLFPHPTIISSLVWIMFFSFISLIIVIIWGYMYSDSQNKKQKQILKELM